jgi:hypothetical protein
MMQFDKFLSNIFLLMSLLENAPLPWWAMLGKSFAQALVHTDTESLFILVLFYFLGDSNAQRNLRKSVQNARRFKLH